MTEFNINVLQQLIVEQRLYDGWSQFKALCTAGIKCKVNIAHQRHQMVIGIFDFGFDIGQRTIVWWNIKGQSGPKKWMIKSGPPMLARGRRSHSGFGRQICEYLVECQAGKSVPTSSFHFNTKQQQSGLRFTNIYRVAFLIVV